MSTLIVFSYQRPILYGVEPIGSRIKRLRKAVGLTQVQLAERVGVDQSTISQLETGVNKDVPGRTLIAMSRELKTTPYAIVMGDDNSNQADLVAEAELIDAFRNASSEQRAALHTMAQAIAAASAHKRQKQ